MSDTNPHGSAVPTDLTVEKIRNMWLAHNDGVYRLEVRKNLGEIVGFLLNATAGVPALMEEITRLNDILRELHRRIGQEAEINEFGETDDYELSQDGLLDFIDQALAPAQPTPSDAGGL